MSGVLAGAFARCLRAHRDRIAVDGVTYAELDTMSARVELPAGDRLRIGIQRTNSVGYVATYLAVLRAGHVPFLADAAFGQLEIDRIRQDCSLDLLVQDDSSTRFADEGRRFELLETTEVCRFSSGSTGRPNCLEFSGDAVLAAARNWVAGTGLTADDRIACFAALSNGLAFNTSLLATFLAGAQLYLGSGLPTAGKVSRLIESTGATRLVGFPALYDSLLRKGSSLGDVRIAISSGAPLRATTRAGFAETCGVAISDYYGIAETGPLTFTPDPGTGGGLGPALPGVQLRTGAELEVRSESMASRYLNAPGLFESRITEDGFYRTGDEGQLRDGELVLTGRTGRTVNVGGRKVDPLEVSEILHDAAGVHAAVVFGVEDSHGETVVAAVVAGETGLGADGVRRHCAAHLPGYKVPVLIEVVDRIPVNGIGKPSVTTLRELVTRRRSQ